MLLLFVIAQPVALTEPDASSDHMQLGSTPDDVRCFERNELSSLRQAWMSFNDSTKHQLHRILEHADHYQRHGPPRNHSAMAPPLRFLEIGVQSGGSARMWRQWHGQRLTYVGIDVDPAASRSHRPEEQIFVEIGSQGDANFVRRICEKYGPFDVVIDDGAHVPELTRRAIATVFPAGARCMKSSSLYVIEDTHTLLRRSHTTGYASDMYNIVGEAFYALHAPNLPADRSRRSKWRPATQTILGDGASSSSNHDVVQLHPVFGDLVAAVHAYDSIVFLRRAQHRQVSDIKRPVAQADSFKPNEHAIRHARTEVG